MKLRDTFNGVIEDYNYARPHYPDGLYHDIEKFVGRPLQQCRILEVGGGTGQASDYFVQLGCRLTILEVGEDQVVWLREKYKDFPNVDVVGGYFEEFAAEERFDLIYSATAFHWIPAEVGYKKAYELLKPGGTMAVFWHMSSVTLHVGPVHDGLNGLKRQYMPEVSLGFDEEGLRAAHEKRLAQIQTGGWFPAPEYHEYRWDDRYDAVRYAALLNSYSDTQEYLSEEKRAEYLKAVAGHIERCGGEVEMPQYVRLYLVKK
ncbi:MAG: class I SAM-dependent methyltransferase [Oscillospiraceae bacterium]|jgi:SAM-dependent methyltransferase|nr:class I SAM-dependent methyltransferase [Oscillospiraceae bacterium]